MGSRIKVVFLFVCGGASVFAQQGAHSTDRKSHRLDGVRYEAIGSPTDILEARIPRFKVNDPVQILATRVLDDGKVFALVRVGHEFAATTSIPERFPEYQVLLATLDSRAGRSEIRELPLKGKGLIDALPTDGVITEHGIVYVGGNYVQRGPNIRAEEPDRDIFVAKFLSDGFLQSDFGQQGVLTISGGTGVDRLSSITVDPHGQGLLLAVDTIDTKASAKVYRIDPNGEVDSKFGRRGLWGGPGYSKMPHTADARATHTSIVPVSAESTNKSTTIALVTSDGMNGHTKVVRLGAAGKTSRPSVVLSGEFTPRSSIETPSGGTIAPNETQSQALRINENGEPSMIFLERPRGGLVGQGVADPSGDGMLFPYFNSRQWYVYRVDADGKMDPHFGNSSGAPSSAKGLRRIDHPQLEAVEPSMLELVHSQEGGLRLLAQYTRPPSREAHLGVIPLQNPTKKSVTVAAPSLK